MTDVLTPELIASAITGLMFALAGIGVYARTKAPAPPKIEGAYKVEASDGQIVLQLTRIAQALEDMVAADKDSFQRDMRERFARMEEALEAQAETDRIKDALTRTNRDAAAMRRD